MVSDCKSDTTVKQSKDFAASQMLILYGVGLQIRHNCNPRQQKLYLCPYINDNICYFCPLVSPTFLTLGNSNKFDCSRLIGKFCGTLKTPFLRKFQFRETVNKCERKTISAQ